MPVQPLRRRVAFSTVEFHEHTMILGDNPAGGLGGVHL
jgi:hypothetical protein